MPDGLLLHLRDTYPVETAWAPQYVGDELRQVRDAAWDARLTSLRVAADARAAQLRGDHRQATELARLMAARGVGVRELARMVPCNPGHISNLRSGKARPSPELAEVLDERLEAGGWLCALVPAHERRRPQSTASWDDGAAADEIAALELGGLAEATEVGTGTVERLELAVDELAIAYPSAPSAGLYGRVRGYLGYVSRPRTSPRPRSGSPRRRAARSSRPPHSKDAPGPGPAPPPRHAAR